MVLTTIDPNSRAVGVYDAYEYTVHSHQYTTEDIPAARFSYELSPIQVVLPSRACAAVPPRLRLAAAPAPCCSAGALLQHSTLRCCSV